MRLYTITPADRTMTREQWKSLDRASRVLGRKFEPVISEHTNNLLLHGAAGYRVSADGEITSATPAEVYDAMFTKGESS